LPADTADDTLRFERFEIVPDQRVVRVDARPVELGARAFDLLLALAQRRERLVSRQELLDLVWPGVVVEEHNITAQISTLRRLLGPQVIRFPFILSSSYPHEILHNWWGNSVFVDYASGNWCEGLTAYMADHLIQEQRGQGEAYRRDVLQKYRSYVKDGRDFPLAEFRRGVETALERGPNGVIKVVLRP